MTELNRSIYLSSVSLRLFYLSSIIYIFICIYSIYQSIMYLFLYIYSVYPCTIYMFVYVCSSCLSSIICLSVTYLLALFPWRTSANTTIEDISSTQNFLVNRHHPLTPLSVLQEHMAIDVSWEDYEMPDFLFYFLFCFHFYTAEAAGCQLLGKKSLLWGL